MSQSAEQTRAVLAAYQQVMTASWPNLHPEMAARASLWAAATAEQLSDELDAYVRAASAPDCPVRIFWKLTPDYKFGGCNQHFARHAGVPRPSLGGDRRFRPAPAVGAPGREVPRRRRSDRKVGAGAARRRRTAKSSTGSITWVRVGKAPIRTAAGVIGILGMYEVLDGETGRRLFGKQFGRG